MSEKILFAEKILSAHRELNPNWKLPKGIELLYPYHQEATWQTMKQFFRQYFTDTRGRILIFGINPGRFGAGITGVAFTDPVRLREVCGIDHPFKLRSELSSIFIYDLIEAFGGAEKFYRQFYITSVCPLGFIKDGKNYNYYDDKQLEKAVTPYIIEHIQSQINIGGNTTVALCLGQGKNFTYFQSLNKQHGFFDHLIPLPHPRWVMQYRRKKVSEFKQKFVAELEKASMMIK